MTDDRLENVEHAYTRLKEALHKWGEYTVNGRKISEIRHTGDGSGHSPIDEKDGPRFTAECMWSKYAGNLPWDEGMLVTAKYILKPRKSWPELSRQRKQSIGTLRGIVKKAIWKVAIMWFTDIQHGVVE